MQRTTHHTSRVRDRTRATRIVAGGLLAMALSTGCSMTRRDADVAAAAPKDPLVAAGQVAALRAIGGSSVIGKIRVIDRGDGASVLVSAINLPTGVYRIAIHETPNCSSPNGFSAGPAWAPPGKRAEDLVPAQLANSENRGEHEVRVAGLRATGPNGVAGKSVVVYAGQRVTEARPDVPNERVACGVFQPVSTLF